MYRSFAILRFVLPVLLPMTLTTPVTLASSQVPDRLVWDELPPVPASPGQLRQPGLAGPFVGAHGDVLLVGGGANFPEALPWDGGRKIWWDDLFVLERHADGRLAWVTDQAFKLPRRMGYGFSFSTALGVVCAGGSDAEQCFAEVFLLAWDPVTREVTRSPLPSLPQPLAFMSGVQVGSVLYLAGGQTTMKDATGSTVFWALDLAQRGQGASFAWKVLPSWPGGGRILPVAAGRDSPDAPQVFVFSGRSQPLGRASTLFDDAYGYDVRSGQWRVLGSIRPDAATREPRCIMAGAAAVDRSGRILVFGGDGGALFRELETHDLAMAGLRAKLKEPDSTAADRTGWERDMGVHLEAKRRIYLNHPGFSRDVLEYDSDRDRWTVTATAPLPPQVTTQVVRWGDDLILPNGEIRPGVRTPTVVRIRTGSR